jgi:hypothetical protein
VLPANRDRPRERPRESEQRGYVEFRFPGSGAHACRSPEERELPARSSGAQGERLDRAARAASLRLPLLTSRPSRVSRETSPAADARAVASARYRTVTVPLDPHAARAPAPSHKIRKCGEPLRSRPCTLERFQQTPFPIPGARTEKHVTLDTERRRIRRDSHSASACAFGRRCVGTYVLSAKGREAPRVRKIRDRPTVRGEPRAITPPWPRVRTSFTAGGRLGSAAPSSRTPSHASPADETRRRGPAPTSAEPLTFEELCKLVQRGAERSPASSTVSVCRRRAALVVAPRRPEVGLRWGDRRPPGGGTWTASIPSRRRAHACGRPVRQETGTETRLPAAPRSCRGTSAPFVREKLSHGFAPARSARRRSGTRAARWLRLRDLERALRSFSLPRTPA